MPRLGRPQPRQGTGGQSGLDGGAVTGGKVAPDGDQVEFRRDPDHQATGEVALQFGPGHTGGLGEKLGDQVVTFGHGDSGREASAISASLAARGRRLISTSRRLALARS